MPQIVTESGATVTPATRAGNMLCQLITPGTGSSGHYPAETLEAAATDRVFPAGTLLFADHPGEHEAFDRPERSIRDVAGVLVEDARWDGGALVAEAKTFAPWTSVLAEMKDAIGMSIRASAEVGEADPATGKPIVKRLVEGISVDFVTKAGRGGAIREVYESARGRATLMVVDETPAPVPATDPTNLPTTPIEATPNSDTTSVPAPVGQSITAESRKDKHMATIQIEESELGRLREDAGRVQALETERDTATRERDEARAQLAESQRRTAAKTIVEAQAREHDIAFSPLEERGLLTDLPLTSDGEFDEAAFTETVTTEAARKAEQAGAGVVRGFGASTNLTEANSGDGISEADYLAQFDVKGA